MKLKKKSGLMGAVIALSAASLVSVGFASWVISQGDDATADGTITVDSVSDQRYLIRALDNSGNPTVESLTVAYDSGTSIAFGYNETGATSDASKIWLKHSADALQENLGASVSFYVSNLPANGSGVVLDYDIAIGGTKAAEFNACVTSTYIGSVAKADVLSLSISDSTTVDYNNMTWRLVTLDIDFTWGAYLNNKNPYAYYNDGTKTANGEKSSGVTWADDARTVLKAIEAASAVTFTVSLSSAAAV